MSTKTKKIILIVAGCILLFAAGFGTGRGLRLARATGAGTDVESGIISAGNATSNAIDSVTVGNGLLKPGFELGGITVDGLEKLLSTNEKQRVCIDEIKRAVDDYIRFTEELQSVYSEISDTEQYAGEVAIQHARLYEQLIDSLQRALEDNDKDSTSQ